MERLSFLYKPAHGFKLETLRYQSTIGYTRVFQSDSRILRNILEFSTDDQEIADLCHRFYISEFDESNKAIALWFENGQYNSCMIRSRFVDNRMYIKQYGLISTRHSVEELIYYAREYFSFQNMSDINYLCEVES